MGGFQSISALAARNLRTVGVEFERETTVTLFPGFKSVQIKCKKKKQRGELHRPLESIIYF